MKPINDVKSWLTNNGFQQYVFTFHDNKIDGEALECITERSLELLIPIIGDRVKFIKLLEKVRAEKRVEAKEKEGEKIQKDDELVEGTAPCEKETRHLAGTNFECLAVNFRTKKQSKHSLMSKRRQRLSRNKRKREQKKLLKRGLTEIIQGLKQENDCLSNQIKIEKAVKEKYFEMWRGSEKEKEKLKTSKMAYYGYNVAAKDSRPSKNFDILQIEPSLLENVDDEKEEIGRGRFGTVCLKKFRSSPVAVKYFDCSTSAKMVEKEAMYLRQCCHINLPIIYGMNNIHKPYFIVTQFYGNDSYEAFTLRNFLSESAELTISGSEHWLHIISRLTDGLCFIHKKGFLHNDIKNDNIVIVCNSSSSFSPILIDFGKATSVSETKKKVLTKDEKERYYKEHFHIASEVIEGIFPQSVKSDMYSFGVVIASIYRYDKCKLIKELAKRCLKPFSLRCTSSEFLSIVLNIDKLH